MLLDFAVENFRSYRDEKLFSLVASTDRNLPQNLISLNGQEFCLLRSAAVYGSNAAGKSNLINAMNCVGNQLQSTVERDQFPDHMAPFALDPKLAESPSRFMVRFMLEEIVYEYVLAMTPEEVHEESLTVFPSGRPQMWFSRKFKDIDFNKTHLKGQKQSLNLMTPLGRPFLAIAAAFEHPQLTAPAQWLAKNLRSRLDFDASYRMRTPELSTAKIMHHNLEFREWVNAFLRHADLGINGVHIAVEERTRKIRRPSRADESGTGFVLEDRSETFYFPWFLHKNCNGDTVPLQAFDESLGTRRLFSMLLPIYDVLTTGQFAIIDEFSASMHPSMVRELVRLFHDPKFNKTNAQLVFATHDATLLSGQLFRRDQVWFAEKDLQGATDIYSLHDIKGVRDDEPFEKGYLRGKYGAIPFFGLFDFAGPSDASTTEDDANCQGKDSHEQDSQA